ncbi:MAG: flagellar filament capping protein FliD [Planctomycetaceae bacterium]
MSGIRTGTGIISGINTQSLIDAMITLQRTQVARLESRRTGFQSTQAGIKTLDANVVSILTSVQKLGTASTFSTFKVANSDELQLAVTANSSAKAGTYKFQTLRTSSTFTATSKGFVNADQQAVGAGTLTISNGGSLSKSTLLDAFHSGEGIRRGTIRITDRAGNSADVDLTNAYTVDDVLNAINSATGVEVTATSSGGSLVLKDTSGSSAGNLIVADLNGGHAAADLGIAGSVASSTLNGSAVYHVTGDFLLSQIDDGNRMHHLQGAPDFSITLSDDTVLEVNLDGAVTVNDVLKRINEHEGNGGKVLAELVDGRIRLTDQSGGGGSSAFAVADINNATVVRHLGLDVAAVGNEIEGGRLTAGINSVLLRNLRGGRGIDNIGSISLTDRTGTSATINLTGAESLDEVLNAINGATSGGGTKLQLTARLNSNGAGIEVIDTSGSSASNLQIADVGAGTLATQLGISVNAAQSSVNSGRLNHRYVNEATSLSKYAPDGGSVASGSIRITDSAGNQTLVDISAAVKTVGDVIQRINLATGISVHAELNETGDGFVIVDGAAGPGTLKIEEAGATTAADLRILGDGVTGGDGKQRLDSRFAAIVTIDADDTLNDVVQKINTQVGFVDASVVDDGSVFNPKRLSLLSSVSGAAGRLIIDDAGLNLSLTTSIAGQDALLRVGENAATGFLVASDSDRFTNVVPGIDVDVLQAGTTPATVTVSRDTEVVKKAISDFVTAVNKFYSSANDLTKFDPETEQRGILQGRGIVLRVESRLSTLIGQQLSGSGSAVRSLFDLGIRVGDNSTLSLNETKLKDALAANPDEVIEFFTKQTTGFADVAEEVVNSFTDPFTGALTLETNALQDSVDSLNRRIESLDAILAVRKERLVQQFAALETLLGEMQAQNTAIGGITRITS